MKRKKRRARDEEYLDDEEILAFAERVRAGAIEKAKQSWVVSQADIAEKKKGLDPAFAKHLDTVLDDLQQDLVEQPDFMAAVIAVALKNKFGKPTPEEVGMVIEGEVNETAPKEPRKIEPGEDSDDVW